MKIRKILCTWICAFVVGQCFASATSSGDKASRIVVPVVGTLVLLTMGAVGYYYFFKDRNSDATDSQSNTTPKVSPENKQDTPTSVPDEPRKLSINPQDAPTSVPDEPRKLSINPQNAASVHSDKTDTNHLNGTSNQTPMLSFDFSKYGTDVDSLISIANDFKPNYEGHMYKNFVSYKNSDFCIPKGVKFKGTSPYISVDNFVKIISSAANILSSEASLLNIDSHGNDVIVVGDVHGNIHSLRGIFLHFLDEYKSGKVSDIVLMGDFGDRRAYSGEVLAFISFMKKTMPAHVHLLRGNHESDSLGSQNYLTVPREVYCKYGSTGGDETYDSIGELYGALPFGAVINGKALCVHAGITKELKAAGGLKKIEGIDRNAENFKLDDTLPHGLIWNEIKDYDPNKDEGFVDALAGTENAGMRGKAYSSKDLKEFLKNNNLQTLFSGHVHHTDNHDLGDGLNHVTLLSSENYSGKGEECNIAVYKPDGSVEIKAIDSTGKSRPANIQHLNKLSK